MSFKGKVFVGVSGGVDSSVAAYLLKRDGYEVHGVFVKTWSPEWLPCTWLEEKRDAMRVCASLGIPFHFLDAEEAYKREVADYMIAEYKAGRTPNPDVLCNRVIKFGSMWDYAKAHHADFLATGHYAQVVSAPDGQGKQIQRAVDPVKDQSYFLWMLNKKDLAHTLFPIGHLYKRDVRSIAQQANLFTATKKDSQGICFLGDVDMREFLSHYIDQRPGEVVDERGQVVGRHEGVVFYTLGERHGFIITEPSPQRDPYYVVGKDLSKNLLIVSHTPGQVVRSGRQLVTLRDPNWMQQVNIGTTYTAHIRYHGTPIETTVVSAQTMALVTGEPIPLGQSLVLYDADVLVGGGIIDGAEPAVNED